MASGASATSSAAYLRVLLASVPQRVLDARVAAVGPAELLQRLYERGVAGLAFRIVRGRVHEHADAPHPVGLLRATGERPCCSAAEKANEITSPHIRAQAQGPAWYRLNEYFDRAQTRHQNHCRSAQPMSLMGQ